jgi:hypothetical protein
MTAAVQAKATAAAPGPTQILADFTARLRGEELPAQVSASLGDLLLDYLRVASIGADMPWSGWARNYMASLGRQGSALVLFGATGLDAVSAGFLNATYAGSIDADDTHVGAMLHPGSIVFSAALSLCGEAPGSDFLAAVAAGYEAMIRIGLSIQPTHFRRGFQSTATCGGFGNSTTRDRRSSAFTRRGRRKTAWRPRSWSSRAFPGRPTFSKAPMVSPALMPMTSIPASSPARSAASFCSTA